MSVNADVAIILLIENKWMFLELIDYMDNEGRGEEVPMRLYESGVRRLMDKLDPPAGKSDRALQSSPERKKVAAALNIDNMKRARLILHSDHSTGVLFFAPFLIEMFRHFDNSRLRHLNSADFENIRGTFNRLLKETRYLQSNDPLDLDFKAHLGVVRGEMRMALAKMKENVDSLQGQASRLADLVENMRVEVVDDVRKAQAALEEINQIYTRSIIPSLQFLSENVDIKDGKPALTALALIGDHYARNGHIHISSDILYGIEAIRSYRCDIDLLRNSLSRYVQQSEAQRRAYDCIEKAWNAIYSATSDLHNGNLREVTLPFKHSVFAKVPLFNGMKTHRQTYEAKFEWSDQNPRAVFKEHLRTAVRKVEAGATIHRLEAAGTGLGEAERAKDARMMLIQTSMDQWPATAVEDLHQAIHRHLIDLVPDITLSEVLIAIDHLRRRKGIRVKTDYIMGRLSNERQALTYYKRHVELTDGI